MVFVTEPEVHNTVGAGGFGRGVYESCYGALTQQGFTHICLLDDDIYLHPEMFARNTAFLRYLKPGYHLGAPMYPTSDAQKIPRRSACFGHKYSASVHPSDTSLGAGLDTADIPAFLSMDRTPDSSGWWWSCFAVADVHRIGLPYPFFIKMDDVEYALRLQAAGVELVIPFSFWVLHDDFEEKYSAAMQYFRFRNRWLLLAQQDRISDPTHFVHEFDKLVRGFVSGRKYEHAQLLLDAMTHSLQRVLLLGDLFHSDINREWEPFAGLCSEFSALKWVLVEGNHDMIPDILLRESGIQRIVRLDDGPFTFTHDPADMAPDFGYHVCGHVHPGIRLAGAGRQRLRLRCFHFSEKQAVMPAYGAFTGMHAIEPAKADRVFA